jgi:hypothetical protein
MIFEFILFIVCSFVIIGNVAVIIYNSYKFGVIGGWYSLYRYHKENGGCECCKS